MSQPANQKMNNAREEWKRVEQKKSTFLMQTEHGYKSLQDKVKLLHFL